MSMSLPHLLLSQNEPNLLESSESKHPKTLPSPRRFPITSNQLLIKPPNNNSNNQKKKHNTPWPPLPKDTLHHRKPAEKCCFFRPSDSGISLHNVNSTSRCHQITEGVHLGELRGFWGAENSWKKKKLQEKTEENRKTHVKSWENNDFPR